MAYAKTSITYGLLGAPQNYLIPVNCGQYLTVVCNGAPGGFTDDGAGGSMQADLMVQDAWRGVAQGIVRVGGRGNATSTATGAAGGFPDGGNGGSVTSGGVANSGGYGGGGSSSFRFDGTATPADTVANTRLIAAGGGGTGRDGTGGEARGRGGAGGSGVGNSGANGATSTGSVNGKAGGGGGSTAGGAGGTANGVAGAKFSGGNGGATSGATNRGGGGGGGGWFGGGGGGAANSGTGSGGGGGGSNYIDFNYFTNALSGKGTGAAPGANGTVVLSYIPTPQAPLMLLPTAQDSEAIIESPYTNLAVNPGMEGTMNWTINGSTSVTAITKQTGKKKSGANSGRIQWKQGTAFAAGRINLVISGLAIGQKYGCSIKVLTDAASGTPKTQFYIAPVAGSGAIARNKLATTVKDGVTWDYLELKFTAVASTHTLQLLNYEAIPNTASTTRFTYFDELLITPIDTFDSKIPDYIDGSMAGVSWTGTANNSSSTQAAVINPDLPFELNWRYVADTLNVAQHWKSRVYYQHYNTGTSSWEAPQFFNEVSVVAIKTVPNGTQLRATIPVTYSYFNSGERYRLYVQDMNVATEAFGPGTFIEFTVPVRPARPVITSPALSWANPPTNTIPNFTAVDTLPMKVTWTVTQKQERYRIRILNYSDIGTGASAFLFMWSSGWQRSSAQPGSSFTALINPTVRGLRAIMYVETHDGIIASIANPTGVYFNPSPVILEGLVSRQGLELEVYDGVSGDFIDVITERMSPTYLDELRGNGAGSFTIKLDDPNWSRSPSLINPRNVVRVKDRGEYIGFWVITGHEPKIIDDGEAKAEGVTVKGLGAYGIWPGDAVMFPLSGKREFNASAALVPASRSFGVASSISTGNWYDLTAWAAATQEVRQDSVVDPNVNGTTGNPWRNAPTDWPSDMTTAYWMWTADYRQFGLPGSVVFKQNFNNLESVPVGVQFYIAADDEAQVYIDGAPWVYANDWHSTTQSEVVFVTPGIHEITIVASVAASDTSVSNWYKNPAGILCGMWVLGTGNAAALHNVYLRSGASWVCTGYGPLPGMTIGDILTTLYNEAIARQITSFGNFNLGFDDVTDSYGFAWPKDGTQWLFDTFAGYDAILDKLTDTAAEIWFDANLKLQASRRRGTNRALLAPVRTYFELVLQSGPSVFWDFQQAMVDVSIPAASITTKGFPSALGNGIAFPTTSGASEAALGFVSQANDPIASRLQEPATEITGVVTTADYMFANNNRNLYFTGSDWMSGGDGDILLDMTSDEGCTFEWLESDAYFSFDFSLFPKDANPNFSTNPSSNYISHGFRVSYGDDSANRFQQGQLILQDLGASSTPPDPDFFTTAWLRLDQRTHHWALNYFNQGIDGYLVLYRDGVEVLTANYPIEYVAGGLAANSVVSLGFQTLKQNPGFGAVAFYDRILTEDEIYDHYLAIQNSVFGSVSNVIGSQGIVRVEPVIFRRAKNVKTAGATVDYSAKTSLIARTTQGATQIDAPPSQRSRFGRIEGYYDGSSKQTSDARRVAGQALRASLLAQTSNTIDIVGDYIPWVDFNVGDWILAPGDYNEELIKRRVVSISVAEDEATGRSIYAIEVDSLNNENSQRVALWLNRTLPQGSLGGLIADSG